MFDCELCDVLNSVEDSFIDESVGSKSGLKRKVLAVCQITYFIINNGRKRTPLHMLNSEAIYNACRSKSILFSFHRFGLAISYDEILRYHTDIASFVTRNDCDRVPLPSSFDHAIFTIGAFDNLDHEEGTLSGIGGTNDTVSVLMQDKPGLSENRKPNISETGLDHRQRQLKQELGCQTLKTFVRPGKRPSLSDDYDVCEGLYKMGDSEICLIRKTDTAWVVSKLDLSDLDEDLCP